MKHTSTRFFFLLFVSLALAACGNALAATEREEVDAAAIFTEAVLTIQAQVNVNTPTPTTLPTQTLSATPTPTAVTMVSENQVTVEPVVNLPRSTPMSTSVARSGVSAALLSSRSGCYNAVYVEDVTIEDGTTVDAGQTFSKVWKIKNIGTCEWKSGFWLAFEAGDDMEGTQTSIKKAVPSGDAVSVSVRLTAPEEEGVYTGYWRMKNKDGDFFGYSVFVKIIVEEDDD